MDDRRAIRAAGRQLQSISQRRLSPMFIQRILEAQQRERHQITAQFIKVRGLMPLLMKRRNGGRWTSEERAELAHQLQALAHLSPYLVVLAMPGSFVVLPVLAWWLDRRRLQRSGAVRTEQTAGNSQDI
jgi:hypothetical protein